MEAPTPDEGRSGQLALVTIACVLTAMGVGLTGPAGIALLILAIVMFLVAIVMAFRPRDRGHG